MFIQIINKGLADTIQDSGRYGYQHLGIQPNGYMDYLSAWMGNSILHNKLDAPVFELHFPASVFKFEEDCVICITGANFVPVINNKSVPMHCAIALSKNDELNFLQLLEGRTTYIAIQGSVQTDQWLKSDSYANKLIQQGDTFNIIPNQQLDKPLSEEKINLIAKLNEQLFNHKDPIRIIPGPAWKDMTQSAIENLFNKPFTISTQANRMGFKLQGPQLDLNIPNNYLSSAVTRGTLQLLPSGDIIVLMANHQTIGGYANLGQIILVDLPRFAQMKRGQAFHFCLTNLATAHQLYHQMYEQLTN